MIIMEPKMRCAVNAVNCLITPKCDWIDAHTEKKPTCNKCPIHCYKPEPKEQMRLVMRYSGPRMLLKHPILAVRHLLHEKREVPEKPAANASNRHKRINAERDTKKS